MYICHCYSLILRQFWLWCDSRLLPVNSLKYKQYCFTNKWFWDLVFSYLSYIYIYFFFFFQFFEGVVWVGWHCGSSDINIYRYAANSHWALAECRSLSEPFSWLWRTWGVSPLGKVGVLAGDPVCVSGQTPLSSEDTEDLCPQEQDRGKSLRLGADKFRLNEERILWSQFWAEKHQKKTLPSFRPSWENCKKAARRTSPLGQGPGFCRGRLRLVALSHSCLSCPFSVTAPSRGMWWSGCANCVWLLLRDLRCQSHVLVRRVSNTCFHSQRRPWSNRACSVSAFAVSLPEPVALPTGPSPGLLAYPASFPRYLLKLPAPGLWGLGTSSPRAPPLAEGHLPAAALGSCTPLLLLGFSLSLPPLFSCPRGNFFCCLMCISNFPALLCSRLPLVLCTKPRLPTDHTPPRPPPLEFHVVRAPSQSPRPPCASVADHLHTRRDLCSTFLLPLSVPSA